MSTKYWLGQSTTVAKEMSATPGGTIASTDIFILYVGNQTAALTEICRFTATTTTVAHVTAGLTAAWNASTHPYATKITASDQTTHVRLLSDVAGMDFFVWSAISNVSGGAAPTLTMATVTANAGPNVWSDGDNWYDQDADTIGDAPVAADELIIANNSTNICWGMDASADAYGSVRIDKTYTGKIGLDYTRFAITADGETFDDSVAEVRDDYLRFLCTSGRVTIGQHPGIGSPAGSGRIKIDTGNQATTIIVQDTASNSADSARPAVRLLTNHSSTAIHVQSAPGGVGLATERPGEASVVSSITVTDPTTASKVITGNGTTLTTWNQAGGSNLLRAGNTVTTINAVGGNLTIDGRFLVTTINNNGATVIPTNVAASGASITTLNGNAGTTDLTQTGRARTITTLNHKTGSHTLKIDLATVTVTTITGVGLCVIE